MADDVEEEWDDDVSDLPIDIDMDILPDDAVWDTITATPASSTEYDLDSNELAFSDDDSLSSEFDDDDDDDDDDDMEISEYDADDLTDYDYSMPESDIEDDDEESAPEDVPDDDDDED